MINCKDTPKKYDGWVSSIKLLDGRVYGLKCAVVEAYPMTCHRCGAPITIKHSEGHCEYCGTNYTTTIHLEER